MSTRTERAMVVKKAKKDTNTEGVESFNLPGKEITGAILKYITPRTLLILGIS